MAFLAPLLLALLPLSAAIPVVTARELLQSTATISANITQLSRNGEWVSVTFTNPNPSVNDAIAFVVPDTADYKKTAPQKFRWAIESGPAGQYLATKQGTLNFHILNHRQSFKFIFVTNVKTSDWQGNFTLLAQTAPIPLANPDEPTAIHLNIGKDTTQMLVQWSTTNRGSPVAKYGTSSGFYGQTAQATTDTYTAADMCGGVANSTGYIFPGIFNNALLTVLKPSTRYYYVVGDSAANKFSPEYSFVTAPAPGSNDMVSFLAMADLGYCELDDSLEWQSNYPNKVTITPPGTLDYIKLQFDNSWNGNFLSFCAGRSTVNSMIQDMKTYNGLVVHNGDISYAQGFVYGWDVYWDMMQPLLATVPYIAVQGNHERDWPNTGDRYQAQLAMDSGGECGVVFEKRIPMPVPAPGKAWYAYAYGPVYFIQISTEIDFAPGSEQHNFVLNQLLTVNRTLYPWVIVGLHRPYYDTSDYGYTIKSDIGNTRDLQAAFEDLFFLYQVDMTIFGHTHTYGRTCPTYQKTCIGPNPDGSNGATVNMLVGHAGASFSWDVFDPHFHTDLWPAVAYAHGYMRVNATRTQLSVEVVNSIDGTLMDKFQFNKPANWAPSLKAKQTFASNFMGNYTVNAIEEEIYGMPSYYFNVLSAAEAYLFNGTAAAHGDETSALLYALANDLVIEDPDSPDTPYVMNPVWQTLDLVFRKYLLPDPTVSQQLKDAYANDFAKIFDLFRQNPNGVFAGPYSVNPKLTTK